jgi:peptidyl-prolyl cis-trans isomerase SurA
MAMAAHNAEKAGRGLTIALCAAWWILGNVAIAQQPANGAAAAAVQTPSSTATPMVLDRVVAVVNGDLLFESDLDEEKRFAVFQPLRRANAEPTRDELLERLIDRRLILQQARMQPQEPISDAQVDTELASLRKTIPECKADRCETDAGWKKFVEDQGFTLDEVRERWRERMEVLRFIEARFRMGIRISQPEIDDYYNKTLKPAFQKQGTAPPPEDTISDRIQEILLQQQVNTLLADWLKSLRAQGTVRVVKPGEAMP